MQSSAIINLVSRVIIIVAVFFAGFYLGGQNVSVLHQPASTRPIQDVSTIKEVSIMLDFGDGTMKPFYAITWYEGQTVFDVLKSVTEKNELELSYKEYDEELGAFIESIDGFKNDFEKNTWWQYWVNNRYGEIGASNYILEPRDVIEWKFTKGQIEF